MRCGNSFNCSGKMIVKHDKNAVWVAAHLLPAWAQCDECGFAPLPEDQPQVMALLLQEFIDHTGYKRDTIYYNGGLVREFLCRGEKDAV